MTRLCPTVIVIALLLLSARTEAEQPSAEEQAAKLLPTGIELLESGKPSEAEVLFRLVINLVPDKGAPHFFLGKALIQQARCEEARRELDKYLRMTGTGRLVKEAATLQAECKPTSAKTPISGQNRPAKAGVPAPKTATAEPAPSQPPTNSLPPRPVLSPESAEETGERRNTRRGSPGKQRLGMAAVACGALSLALALKYGLEIGSIEDDLARNSTAWTDEEIEATAGLVADGERAETRMLVFTGLGVAAIATGALLYRQGRPARESKALAIVPALDRKQVSVGLFARF